MNKVEQEPGRPKALVWVLVCVIGFVLITSGVLAVWFIVLEEKTGRTWQAAGESTPAAQAKSLEVEETADGGADEEMAGAKKEAPAPTSSQPALKEGELVKGVPRNEGTPTDGDRAAPAPSPKEAPSRPSSKDEIGIGSDGWFEVNCVGGGFQVLVPGVPIFQRFEQPGASQSGDEYQARNSTDGLIYRGSSILLARDSEGAGEGPADHLKSSIVRLLPKPAFELKRDKEMRHDGQTGREFSALGLGGINVAGWLFLVPGPGGQARLFCFTVTGPSANLNATDVKRFFQSVKLRGAGVPAKSNDVAALDNQKSPQAKATDTEPKENDKVKTTDGARPIIPEIKAQPPKTAPVAGNSARGAVGISPIPAKLSAHVGAVIDAQAKAAALFLAGGMAKLYAYPEFQALGVYKLTAGTAHRPVYHKASGRLFVLAASVKAKDPTGKPGGSQVAVYDFRDLLDGKLTNNVELAPAKLIALPAYCSQLCVSADGAWLYALEAGKTTRALRISAATGELSGAAALPEFTTSIALAKDGNRLYALSHLTARLPKGPPPRGALIVVQTDTMKLQKTVSLPLDPFDLQAAEESIVFISGHGGVRSEILIVDVAKELALLASWKGVPPSATLKLADDERTIFVANWKGTPPAIGVFDIPSSLAGSDLPYGQWVQAPPASARGDIVATPDNRYLLCDSGAVFSLRGAEPAAKGNATTAPR